MRANNNRYHRHFVRLAEIFAMTIDGTVLRFRQRDKCLRNGRIDGRGRGVEETAEAPRAHSVGWARGARP
jgi:hypothetical protein